MVATTGQRLAALSHTVQNSLSFCSAVTLFLSFFTFYSMTINNPERDFPALMEEEAISPS